MNYPYRTNQENGIPFQTRPALPFGYDSPAEKPRIHDQSFSPQSYHSPMSGLDRDKEFLISGQIRKLGEMRKSQIEFFDAKMLQLKEREAYILTRLTELAAAEDSLRQREDSVGNQLRRIEMQKDEIAAIRDLLRAESESVELTSADLKKQVRRYERILKVTSLPKASVDPGAVQSHTTGPFDA